MYTRIASIDEISKIIDLLQCHLRTPSGDIKFSGGNANPRR